MSNNLSEMESPNSNLVRNIVIAVVAIALSIAVFLAMQTKTGAVSLESQAQRSVPLEVAVSNGKPTIIEFYADWCTTCQAMAKDLAKLKQEYNNSVNFVMLNVDNDKWLPEILQYRVDGIPHFVFLNSQAEAIAETIGEQPRTILEADLDALIADAALPYTYSTGQVSQFNAPVSPTKNSQDNPRSHGTQVK